MSILETSSVQDVMDSLGTENPAMTIRISKSENGSELIDIVTEKGMESAAAKGAAHLEVSERQKMEMDIPAQMLEKIEKAFENSPVGHTPQTAELENLLNKSDSAATPQEANPKVEDKAVVIDFDDTGVIKSVHLGDPKLMNQKVLDQLHALAEAGQLGEQGLQIVDKVKKEIFKIRPDLAPHAQAEAADVNRTEAAPLNPNHAEAAPHSQNAVQIDEQNEGTKIVPSSAGSLAKESGKEVQSDNPGHGAKMMAQENYQGEGVLPHAISSGSQTNQSATTIVDKAQRQGTINTQRNLEAARF